MRFIHSADWQLGKSYGRMPSDVSAALYEARFDAIDAIGRGATERGIGHILVAGDVFETVAPDDRVIVQACSRMARYACRWWLLPGNHDFARAGNLWNRMRAKAPPNVVVVDTPEPLELEEDAWLLPAPLEQRHQQQDPTERLPAMTTPSQALRIGLAHGSVRDFGSRGEANNLIAPDRATTARLDYLALGDWHGQLPVNPRTWYAGTPETDRYKHDALGAALVVRVERGSEAQVESLSTGRYRWLQRRWTMSDETAARDAWQAIQAEIEPSTTLLDLTLVGTPTLANRVSIIRLVEDEIAHTLRDLQYDASALVAAPTADELAGFAAEGTIGAAARALSERSAAGGPEGAVALRALERLFVEHERAQEAV